jgi:hypothetical protein
MKMRIVAVAVVALVAAALVAGMVLDADAANSSKSHKRHAKRHYPRYAAPGVGNQSKNPDASGWYPHDSSQLPFGSARWWEQKEREGGRDTM